jgi:hypothetical protein
LQGDCLADPLREQVEDSAPFDSRAPQKVFSARTRIERDFDRDAVRRLKQSSEADIAGTQSARGWSTSAICSCPIVVGGGKRALPDSVRAQLELLDERAGSETASFTSTTP